MKDLPATGERFIPENTNDPVSEAEHYLRYDMALPLVKDKIILDIASGSGYGTHFLASSAREAYGVEIDQAAVDYSREHYPESNLHFMQGSVENIPLEDHSVDVVVSFETIEHVSAELQIRMMEEIRRVLKDDGILFISSPDKYHYSEERNYVNPFHVHELYSAEFKALLGNYFSHIKFAGQLFLCGSFAVWNTDVPGKIALYETLTQTQSLELKKPHYHLAIAGNRELPEVFNSIAEFTPGSTAWQELSQLLESRQSELTQTQEQLASAQKQLELEVPVIAYGANPGELFTPERSCSVDCSLSRERKTFTLALSEELSKRRVFRIGVGATAGIILLHAFAFFDVSGEKSIEWQHPPVQLRGPAGMQVVELPGCMGLICGPGGSFEFDMLPEDFAPSKIVLELSIPDQALLNACLAGVNELSAREQKSKQELQTVLDQERASKQELDGLLDQERASKQGLNDLLDQERASKQELNDLLDQERASKQGLNDLLVQERASKQGLNDLLDQERTFRQELGKRFDEREEEHRQIALKHQALESELQAEVLKLTELQKMERAEREQEAQYCDRVKSELKETLARETEVTAELERQNEELRIRRELETAYRNEIDSLRQSVAVMSSSSSYRIGHGLVLLLKSPLFMLRRLKALAARVRGGCPPASPPMSVQTVSTVPPDQIPSEGPVFSILMPTYNTPPQLLDEAVESVLAQSYPRWELCIYDDASPSEKCKARLRRLTDPRIKVKFGTENGGITAGSIRASELATGDYIVLLDHDDRLHPDCLLKLAQKIDAVQADFTYADEAKFSEVHAPVCEVAFKPDWSPDYLMSQNYICHPVAIRKSLFDEAGGFRPGFEGSQDHDLFLRCTEKARRIEHIPEVLYYWRVTKQSTASNADAKPYCWENGRKAVEEALKRRKVPYTAGLGSYVGGYKLVPAEKDFVKSVTVVFMPTVFTEQILDNVKRCRARKLPFEANWAVPDLCRPEDAPDVVTYSSLKDLKEKVNTEYLIFVDSSLTFDCAAAISGLLMFFGLPHAGCVGGRIIGRNDRIESAGLRVTPEGTLAGNFRGRERGWGGASMRLLTVNDFSCFDSCIAVRRSSLGLLDSWEGYEKEVTWTGLIRLQFALRREGKFCLLGSADLRRTGTESRRRDDGGLAELKDAYPEFMTYPDMFFNQALEQ